MCVIMPHRYAVRLSIYNNNINIAFDATTHIIVNITSVHTHTVHTRAQLNFMKFLLAHRNEFMHPKRLKYARYMCNVLTKKKSR